MTNKGDLISREALKKAITEATYNFEQIPIRVDKVQEIIDNAPTVEERSYEQGFRDGYAQCINDKEERKENNRLFPERGKE